MAKKSARDGFTESVDARFLYPDEVQQEDAERVADMLESAKEAALLLVYDGDIKEGAILMLYEPESGMSFRATLDDDRIVALIGQLAAAAGFGAAMVGIQPGDSPEQEMARDG